MSISLPKPLGVSLTETVLDGRQRVVVTSVRDDSPAKGLVHVGDVVTAALGRPAKSLSSVVRTIRDASSHATVNLDLERCPHPFNPLAKGSLSSLSTIMDDEEDSDETDGDGSVDFESVNSNGVKLDEFHGDVDGSNDGISGGDSDSNQRQQHRRSTRMGRNGVQQLNQMTDVELSSTSSSKGTANKSTTTRRRRKSLKSMQHDPDLTPLKQGSSAVYNDDVPSIGVYAQQDQVLSNAITAYLTNRKVNQLFAADDYKELMDTAEEIVRHRTFLSAKSVQLIFSVMYRLKRASVPLTSKFYNVVMVSLIRCEHAALAVDVFCEIESPSLECFTTLAKAYASLRRPDDAIALIPIMRSLNITPNVRLYNSVISSCVKGGQLTKARSLFSEMVVDKVRPNVVSWNIIINWYVRQNKGTRRLRGALQAFADMKASGVKPDLITFTTLMKAYTSSGFLNKAEEVFAEMKRTMPRKLDAMVYNTLLHAYAGRVDWRRCLELLDEMVAQNAEQDPDYDQSKMSSAFQGDRVPTHSRTFSKRRPWLRTAEDEDSLQCDSYDGVDNYDDDSDDYDDDESNNNYYNDVDDEGDPRQRRASISTRSSQRWGESNRLVWSSSSMRSNSLSSFASSSSFSSSSSSSLSSRRNIQPNMVSYSLVIKACAGAGRTNQAREVFERMMEDGFYPPNSAAVVSLLSGYAKNGQLGNCFEVLKSLRTWGVFPDVRMLSTVMHGCLISDRAELALSVYSKFKSARLEADVVTSTLLLQAYGAIGEMEKMFNVVKGMQRRARAQELPTTFTYNELITCCLRRGETQLALKALDMLLDEQKSRGVKINRFTMDALVLPIVPLLNDDVISNHSNKHMVRHQQERLFTGEGNGTSHGYNNRDGVAVKKSSAGNKMKTLSDSDRFKFLKGVLHSLRKAGAVGNGLLYRGLLVLCDQCDDLDLANQLVQEREQGQFLMTKKDSMHVRMLEDRIRVRSTHDDVVRKRT